MNYTFSLLPEKVTFLYGSIYALRKGFPLVQSDLFYGEDTEAETRKTLFSGKNNHISKKAASRAFKKHSFHSLSTKNDFLIPSGLKYYQVFQ